MKRPTKAKASLIRSARSMVFPVAIVFLIVWIDRDLLNLQFPFLLLNGDNVDIMYPLFKFLITGLQHGELNFYQPFQWAGTRLFGDPNFQINFIELAVGVVFGTKAIFQALNIMYLVERMVGALGMYVLIGEVCVASPRYTRAALALLYIFSYGAFVAGGSLSTSVVFATAPWLLFTMAAVGRLPIAVSLAGVTATLYVQFSYGQLQFSVYTGWLVLSFVAFWLPRTVKLRAALILAVGGTLAALLSAYYLIPLADNLFLAQGGPGGRVSADLSEIQRQRVPLFYLVRLFVTQIFDKQVANWWPIWADGWTRWEAFSAFEGIVLSVLVVFGLLLRRVPLYFKLLYLFIIFSVAFRPGLFVLYVLNLGTEVPYGRQTVLLGLVAPVIAAFTLTEIVENRRVAAAFAGWCGLWCAGLLAIYLFGFPETFVSYAFEELKHSSHSYAYHPGDAQRFYALNAQKLQSSFAIPIVFMGIATLIALMLLAVSGAWKWRQWLPSRQAPLLLAALLCFLSLGDAVGTYQYARYQVRGGFSGRDSLDKRYPAEEALIAVGQVKDGPIEYRVHPDIYFAEHRRGAYETFALSGARPQDNRFRTLPNFLAGEDVPVTTGYGSLIPSAKRFSALMMWPLPGEPVMERAIGLRTPMRPAMLDAFSIKWVLRHQPSLTAKLQGQADFADPVEQQFLASSRLIYADDVYRLYEYLDARPAIDIPKRIAFGQEGDAVGAFKALEKVGPWVPTAALPRSAIGALPAELRSSISETNGVPVLDQAGVIVKTAGKAGHWTTINVKTDKPAIVLLGVKYDKWWHVRVNGHPAPLISANSIFAAVQVPRGDSEILVELRPWSAWLGLAVSGTIFVVLLGLLVGIAVARLRRRVPSPTVVAD